MNYVISEDVEVVLNGQRVLLEKGDKIAINEPYDWVVYYINPADESSAAQADRDWGHAWQGETMPCVFLELRRGDDLFLHATMWEKDTDVETSGPLGDRMDSEAQWNLFNSATQIPEISNAIKQAQNDGMIEGTAPPYKVYGRGDAAIK